jgi:HEAT repeat protein
MKILKNILPGLAIACTCLAMAAHAQPADIATLIKTLSVPSIIERVQAVQALLDMGPNAAPAIPALLEVLKTEDGLEELTTTYTPERVFAFNPVQNNAVKVLVKIGTPAIEPIQKAIKTADPKGPQLSYLAEVLVKMQRPETTAVVDALLLDDRPDVREQAADALRYSKDPGSRDLLIVALGDNDPGVRANAADSLENITGVKLGQDPLKWTAWRAGR